MSVDSTPELSPIVRAELRWDMGKGNLENPSGQEVRGHGRKRSPLR